MKWSNFTDIAKAYAGILFLQHPLLGVLFIALTFWSPITGLAGLLSALTSMFLCVFLKLPHISSKAHICASALTGLSLGALFQLSGQSWLFVFVGGLLTTFLSILISDSLWRRDRLPALCLAFIFSAVILSLIVRRYVPMVDLGAFDLTAGTWLYPWVNLFFYTISATLFSPNLMIGLLLFIAILIQSRYLGFLAIAGFTLGLILLNALMGTQSNSFYVWTCFNFALTAMAIGGAFTVPGRSSFIYAMLAVMVSVLLVIAMRDLLLIYHLPVMALPFVITTLLFITVLKRRSSMEPPWLCLNPGLPENDYEQSRLARSRCGEPNSVPLLLPFYGAWNVYQGFNGPHTHKAPWNHAVDFYITEKDLSFCDQGVRLEDYYCFALPIISPVYGEVIATLDTVPDNLPGTVNVHDNWGNYILIRLSAGHCVMLAHLKHRSVKVKLGDWISPKTELAACGSSGRSPQPHLHIHVQKNAEFGSPTHLFHFCSVVEKSEQHSPRYKLTTRPIENVSIQSASHACGLATVHQHLPVGRYFTYKLTESKANASNISRLLVEVTLMGQFRLVSDSGASSAFEEINGVIAFYDRQGPADQLLDMWLLSFGLTPLTELAQQWQDAPSAKLLPLKNGTKLLMAFRFILGTGLESQYQRQWESAKGVWIQHSTHALRIGLRAMVAEATIELDRKFVSNDMTLSFNGFTWRAQLINNGLIQDHGIPGWREQPVNETSSNLATASLL